MVCVIPLLHTKQPLFNRRGFNFIYLHTHVLLLQYTYYIYTREQY
jgi:hypothetical protein